MTTALGWRPIVSRVGLLALAAGVLTTTLAADSKAPAEWTDDLSPIAAADWSYDRAAHLLERAGFGATPDEIARLAAMTPRQAVDSLVDYDAAPRDLKPFDESGIWDPGMDPFPPSRAEAVRLARERGEGLGEKVLPAGCAAPAPAGRRQVLLQPGRQQHRNAASRPVVGEPDARRRSRPLEEKLTLFWHGHFATGENKVRDYRMMLRQNEMFRAQRLGQLPRSAGRDPEGSRRCSSISTTARTSRRIPNENFGRELLELFTMGVGNYTERDVREAARAFTGWTNDVLDVQVRRRRSTTSARRRSSAGRDRSTARTSSTSSSSSRSPPSSWPRSSIGSSCARRSPPPVKAELGRTFRDSGYQMKPLLKRIFLSKDFYSPPSYATQIKSPVHLVVSTYRKMGLREVPTIPDFGRMTAASGSRCSIRRTSRAGPAAAPGSRRRRCCSAATCSATCCSPTSRASARPIARCRPTDARVGERLAQGMDITEATKEDDDAATMAESNMMVDRDEDYNTRYGGYKGYLLAFERTKLIPRQPARDRSDGDGRRPPAPTRSTRSSITSSTGSCRVPLADEGPRRRSSISCAASSGRRACSRARSSKNRCASCSISC